MQRRRGPKTQFSDQIPKAFDLYIAGVLTLKEIGESLDVKSGTVMYLVKADPRYPAWKAAQGTPKATDE